MALSEQQLQEIEELTSRWERERIGPIIMRRTLVELVAEVRLLRDLVRDYAGLLESDYPLSGHHGEQYRRAKAALGEASS
jgi:hypothetical protein